MKKYISFIAIVLISSVIISGCTDANSKDENYEDTYETGYEEGYDEGYKEGYADSIDIGLKEESSLKNVIISLVYDKEFELVEKLQEYNEKVVGEALEYEFGVRDLTLVISYLDEMSQEIIGKCEICEEPVYADEMTILPNDLKCAHSECVRSDAETGTIQIKKE